ncbi:MAG TPA: prepilin-type N-terminal cleavage/methylation domain-containing protein [Lentisphaerae bacterium]|jgi:prepilin-type N-terminal cleavage/methylation domain-containing protein|nr:prepilin-type N-terminal cleavage/methylation domain-containing protein [Lentisphaerota bacterium]
MSAHRSRKKGFTLIELLLALVVFSLAVAMAAGAFWSILRTWNRGGELLEQLHYGEFAMEQLVTALRGAAWFPSKPSAFGFWLDDRGGTSASAANEISWVTSGSAFLPPDSPLQNGLHRISITVEGSGPDRSLVVRAWPHLTESEDVRPSQIESRPVVPQVEGFSCEWYDFEEDRWSQDWETTNSLPKLLRVTLTMQKRKDFDERLQLRRMIPLEVAALLPGTERRDRSQAPGRGRGGGEGGEGGGGGAPAEETRPAPSTDGGSGGSGVRTGGVSRTRSGGGTSGPRTNSTQRFDFGGRR